MFFEPKIVAGFIAATLGVVGYIPYLRDIYIRSTKPHVFTWLIFGTLNVVVLAAQLHAGAGAGAWVTIINVVFCALITIAAFMTGERDVRFFDWVCFVAACFGIVAWILTDNPVTAVAIESVTDALALAPTVRKAYYKPYEETAVMWFLGVPMFMFAIFSMDSINPTTILHPVSVIIIDGTFVAMLLIRRKQLARARVSP